MLFRKIAPSEISKQFATLLTKPKKWSTAGQLLGPAQCEMTRRQTITKPRSVTNIDAVHPED
jgi:hypothetical protein